MPAETNWTKFHTPGEPLKNFTKHSPFPSDEMKDTYVSKPRKKRRMVRPGQAFEVLMRKGKHDG
jgi:hypothetical protein